MARAEAVRGIITAHIHCRGLSLVGDRFLGTFAFYDKQWATRRCYGFIWLAPADLALASPAYSHVVKLRLAPNEKKGATHKVYDIVEWSSFNTRVLHAAIVPLHLPHLVSAEVADFVAAWTHFPCGAHNTRQARAPLAAVIGYNDTLVRALRVPVARTTNDVYTECVLPLQQVRQVPTVSQAKDRSQRTLTSAAATYPGANEVAAGFVLRDDSSTCLWLYRAAAVPALFAFCADNIGRGDLVGLTDNTLFALDYLLHAPDEATTAARLEVLRKRQPRFFAECVCLRASTTDSVKALVERVFAVPGAREIAAAAHISHLFSDRAAFANSAVDRVAWASVAHATGYDKKTASEESLQLMAKRIGARVQAASFEPDARYLATVPHAFYTVTTAKLRRRVKEVRATIRNLGVTAFIADGTFLVDEVVTAFTARHNERVGGAFAPLVVRTGPEMRALVAMGAPGTVPPTSTTAVLVLNAHMLSCEQFFALFDVLERCWASVGVDVEQTQVELCGCAALCTLQSDGTGTQFLPFRFLFCDRLRYIADFAELPLPLLAARWLALADEKRLTWRRAAVARSVDCLVVCAGRKVARPALRTLAVSRLAHEAERRLADGQTVCMALDEVKFMALDEFFTLMVVLHAYPALTVVVLTETGAPEALPLERLQRGTCLATHYPFPEEAVY